MTPQDIKSNIDRILAKADRKRLGNEERMPPTDAELTFYRPNWADISRTCRGWRKCDYGKGAV